MTDHEIRVSCPKCGAPMVGRVNPFDLSAFLGCERYPACLGTLPRRPAIEVERAGAQPLPGMEL